MNNEIKKILERIKNWCDLALDDNCNTIMYKYEFVAILDYITNLQKENKRLVELCDKYEEEHKTTFKMWKKDLKNFEHEKNRELKSRITKAIEFIEEELTFYITIGGTNERKLIGYNKAFDELLKILKGSDKE